MGRAGPDGRYPAGWRTVWETAGRPRARGGCCRSSPPSPGRCPTPARRRPPRRPRSTSPRSSARRSSWASAAGPRCGRRSVRATCPACRPRRCSASTASTPVRGRRGPPCVAIWRTCTISPDCWTRNRCSGWLVPSTPQGRRWYSARAVSPRRACNSRIWRRPSAATSGSISSVGPHCSTPSHSWGLGIASWSSSFGAHHTRSCTPSSWRPPPVSRSYSSAISFRRVFASSPTNWWRCPVRVPACSRPSWLRRRSCRRSSRRWWHVTRPPPRSGATGSSRSGRATASFRIRQNVCNNYCIRPGGPVSWRATHADVVPRRPARSRTRPAESRLPGGTPCRPRT